MLQASGLAWSRRGLASLLHPPLRDTESPSVDYVYQGMSRPVASPGGGRRRAGLSPRSARDRRSGGGAQVGAPLQFMDGLEDLVGVAEDGSFRDLLGVVSDERARGQRGASVASTVVPWRAAHSPLEDVQAMDRHVVDRARGLDDHGCDEVALHVLSLIHI